MRTRPALTAVDVNSIAAAAEAEALRNRRAVRRQMIVVDGEVVGAVGVSGVKAGEDAQVARAGVAAIGAKWEL